FISSVLLVTFLTCDVVFPLTLQGDRIVIAVVDFRNTGQDSQLDYLENTIPETIITRMAKGGRVEIVERSRLQDALKEMELGMAGVVDEQTAVQLGRAVGATAILLGSFVSIGQLIRINARLIDVQTSRIIKAESVQGEVGEEIFDLMDRMTDSMEAQLVGETAQAEEIQPAPIVEPQEKSVSKGKPFYSKWWFWTLVGVGVAGGVAAAALGGEKESETATVAITVNIP
ncbi:MAG: FlgO family outer membrane protein, partial [Fidelibacterota bacterium]